MFGCSEKKMEAVLHFPPLRCPFFFFFESLTQPLHCTFFYSVGEDKGSEFWTPIFNNNKVCVVDRSSSLTLSS